MEVLLLILVALMLLLFVRQQGLGARLERIEAMLAGEAAPVAAVPEPVTIAASEPETREEERWQPEPAGEPASLAGLFENLVGGRMLIWIGGIALGLGGIFLILYSVELVPPPAQMALAALLGLGFVAAGEYARAGRLLADDPRVAQALVGAGLAVLYGTVYGSHVLYGLIGMAVATAAMLAVTVAALGLALRHGAPTAAMGLLGGFLTPLLIGDPDAGAVPLLAYLAFLNAAIFAVAAKRGWTWLAAIGVALSFVWTAVLLARPPEDAIAAGIFILALSIAASLIRPGEGRALRLVQPAAVGAVQLAVLVARIDIGLPAWLLFGALSAAALALAALRAEYRLAPPLALGLALGLLLAKALTGDDPLVPWVAGGILLLFGGAGAALALRRGEALWAAVACAGMAGPAAILRGARPELLAEPGWAALALALALGPILLLWALRGRAEEGAPADLGLLAAGGAAALLLGIAVHDLLPSDWVAAGWAALAVGAALAARRIRDSALALVAIGIAFVAVARSAWMVQELSGVFILAAAGLPVLAGDLPGAAEALWALALPAVLIGLLAKAMPPQPRARRALPAVAGLFALAALYIWFKQLYGLADREDFVARGMAERTILTQLLFASGWLLASGRARIAAVEPDLVRIGGAALTALAAARLAWFDLLAHNPAIEDQWVGRLPLLNLILPAYMFGAAWLYAARRRAAGAGGGGLWLALFLASLTVGTMLLVRQAFQGPILTGPDTPLAEFYGYSLAGLILSAGLLLAGMRLPDKALRLAGLILLTATIVKVFLIDASELEGILRILSFLGLGAALIGIGRLYGPVLRAERGRG